MFVSWKKKIETLCLYGRNGIICFSHNLILFFLRTFFVFVFLTYLNEKGSNTSRPMSFSFIAKQNVLKWNCTRVVSKCLTRSKNPSAIICSVLKYFNPFSLVSEKEQNGHSIFFLKRNKSSFCRE